MNANRGYSLDVLVTDGAVIRYETAIERRKCLAVWVLVGVMIAAEIALVVLDGMSH
jgi:hypothetical protein